MPVEAWAAQPSTRAETTPADRTWDDEPPRGGRRLYRTVLFVALLVFVAGAAALGVRPSTLGQLEAEVAAGEVDVVHVAGGLRPGDRGYATAEVTWRRGWFAYGFEAVEARPRSEGRAVHDRRGTPVARDLGARLSDIAPDVQIVRTDYPSGSSSAVLGRRLPGWLGWVGLVLLVGTLALLARGPQPWRATRWAWFWLVLGVPPVGVPAFLLLGGPSPLVPKPRPGAWRLTGGWAFILAGVLDAVILPAG